MKINGLEIIRTIVPDDICMIYLTEDGSVWLDLEPDDDDGRVSLMGSSSVESTDDEIVIVSGVSKNKAQMVVYPY
jgi:hypothetical protein